MARGSWPFGVAVVALAVLSLSRFWPEEVDFVGQVNRPHARAKVARRRGVKGKLGVKWGRIDSFWYSNLILDVSSLIAMARWSSLTFKRKCWLAGVQETRP